MDVNDMQKIEAMAIDGYNRINYVQDELQTLSYIYSSLKISIELDDVNEIRFYLLKAFSLFNSIKTQIEIINNIYTLLADNDEANEICGFNSEKVRNMAVSFILTMNKFLENTEKKLIYWKKQYMED